MSRIHLSRVEMLSIIQAKMPDKRYRHTIGVMETAIDLANQYGADPYKAEVAAIFHDYAKFRDVEEMRSIVRSNSTFPQDLLDYNSELLHAPVGAYLVRMEVGIQDEEILDAIRYHTTGRTGMTLLDRIIYLADYIEPGRKFPGVDEVRVLAKQDLDLAIIQSLRNGIAFLEKQGQAVYPWTRQALQSLTAQT